MRHPLHELARLTTRERIREAIDGCCVPSLDPELHADRISAAVLRVRVPDLASDQQNEARRIADQTKCSGLQTKGSIA